MTTVCLEQNFVVTKCNVHVFILAWLSYLCVDRMEWHLCSLQAIVVTIGRLSSFWKQGPILTYKTRWEQHELLPHCISFWTVGCGQISVLGLSNMAASDTWLRKALGSYWVDHFFSLIWATGHVRPPFLAVKLLSWSILQTVIGGEPWLLKAHWKFGLE